MAECRSLIEFLRAFEHHRKAADSSASASACSRSRRASAPHAGGSFCDSTPMAVVDAVMLLAVVAALGFLVIPYLKLLLVEMGALLHPAASCLSAAAFFGAAVTVAAAGVDGLLVDAMYGVKIVADANVADCADASYDLVALPGGIPGADNLGGCAALESIVRRHALKGGLYAAICAAPPLALARWGLLNGVKATAHPAFVEKFPAEVTAMDANVVVDGKVVTARGPATAMEFALALVEQLYGKQKVDQIAKPMLVRYEPGYTFKELNPIQWQCSGTPKVLIPLANANEDMEVIMIIDALRRASADVVVASAEEGVEIVARYNMRIVTDMLLDAAADQQFDLIIVPGGMPGAKTLSGKEKLVALLKQQAEANKPYSAICAATAQVLEPHGLLKGKKATTYTSMVGLLADASECENRVLVDGNLITSRSPGTAMEFAVSIVEKLLGREAVREVAEGLLLV